MGVDARALSAHVPWEPKVWELRGSYDFLDPEKGVVSPDVDVKWEGLGSGSD